MKKKRKITSRSLTYEYQALSAHCKFEQDASAPVISFFLFGAVMFLCLNITTGKIRFDEKNCNFFNPCPTKYKKAGRFWRNASRVHSQPFDSGAVILHNTHSFAKNWTISISFYLCHVPERFSTLNRWNKYHCRNKRFTYFFLTEKREKLHIEYVYRLLRIGRRKNTEKSRMFASWIIFSCQLFYCLIWRNNECFYKWNTHNVANQLWRNPRHRGSLWTKKIVTHLTVAFSVSVLWIME